MKITKKQRKVRGPFQHHFRVSRQLEELEARRAAHTQRTGLGATHVSEGKGAMMITSGWQLNRITWSTQSQLTVRQRSLC